MDRETMEFDVIIIGAGPAGLSAACRLMQDAASQQKTLSVGVLEKGSEVGSHILSGAVLDPRALNELFPDWQSMDIPSFSAVTREKFYYLHDKKSATAIPGFLQPSTLHNKGNYIISLANFCRWLAKQAENLGVDIFPGYSAQSLIVENGCVKGVITGDMGLNADSEKTENFTPGIALRARQTIFAEGARGHLGRKLTDLFNLRQNKNPQHYGLGIKEIWQINAKHHQQGLVTHTAGWPLSETNSTGGGFLYHMDNRQVSLGLITDLSYKNPYLDPFEEFQRLKHHPVISQLLQGGKRISYGARAIAKGGLQSLPQMHFPGGLIIGCNAGTLNFSKIKGIHTAMKSGLLAGESTINFLYQNHKEKENNTVNVGYTEAFRFSWAYRELHKQRNFAPYIRHFGTLFGGLFCWVDMNIFRGKLPWTLQNKKADYQTLKPAARCQRISYPKPDGIISFDRLSSIFLTNISHRHHQPCHLLLENKNIPLRSNLPAYDEPAQRYCPAGVYEMTHGEVGGKQFIINAQNCIHCKTCDIKDPAQNITWVPPEGGSGPNYPNM